MNKSMKEANLYIKEQNLKREKLINHGVLMYDPSRVDIRGEINHLENLVIDVNVIFNGIIHIGKNVKIGANCILTDCVIGDNVTIEPNSIIENSIVGDNVSIGPFARLRPDSKIKKNAKIGNFVEVKKSIIGSGSKVNHFSYIGDASIGEKVNIGAGAITANYDGVNKSETIIEDNAFIGTNSTLIAPVKINKNGFVAAGSVINQDVDESELAVARNKQRNISGWKRPSKN